MVATKGKDRALFGGGGRGEAELARQKALEEKDLSRELDAIEKTLDELRATYELYFMGVERAEPTIARDKLKARMRRLRDQRIRNTAANFRMQQLKARLVSLESYWQRTLRQKEAGTYHRDVARARRRELERQAREAREGQAARVGEAIPAPDADPSRQADQSAPTDRPRPAATRRSGAAATRPRATSAEDLTDDKLRRLYDTYVGARRRCGESTELRFDDMASTLRKQVPQVLQRSGARAVEFKVVIRGGKAVLKALPRDEG